MNVNVKAMAVSQLKKMREPLARELAGIDAAIAALGGGVVTEPGTVPTRRRKRKLSPEQIKAMVEGRQKAREAKKASETATDEAPELSPIAEARRKRAEATANTGHAQVRGASLAEAAS